MSPDQHPQAPFCPSNCPSDSALLQPNSPAAGRASSARARHNDHSAQPVTHTARRVAAPGRVSSHDCGLNNAWLDAAMITCVLLSWRKLLTLDGDLERAEQDATLPRPARRRPPRPRRTPQNPENRCDLTLDRSDRNRLAVHPGHLAPYLSSKNPSRRAGKEPRGPWIPRPPGPAAGPPSFPGPEIHVQKPASPDARGSHQPLCRVGGRAAAGRVTGAVGAVDVHAGSPGWRLLTVTAGAHQRKPDPCQAVVGVGPYFAEAGPWDGPVCGKGSDCGGRHGRS